MHISGLTALFFHVNVTVESAFLHFVRYAVCVKLVLKILLFLILFKFLLSSKNSTITLDLHNTCILNCVFTYFFLNQQKLNFTEMLIKVLLHSHEECKQVVGGSHIILVICHGFEEHFHHFRYTDGWLFLPKKCPIWAKLVFFAEKWYTEGLQNHLFLGIEKVEIVTATWHIPFQLEIENPPPPGWDWWSPDYNFEIVTFDATVDFLQFPCRLLVLPPLALSISSFVNKHLKREFATVVRCDEFES